MREEKGVHHGVHGYVVSAFERIFCKSLFFFHIVYCIATMDLHNNLGGYASDLHVPISLCKTLI